MIDLEIPSVFAHLENLDDPRIERGRRHELIDIIAITICAAICGANCWTQVEMFAKAKLEWFKSFLKLPNGIPSHDTFGRFFSLLDPKAFQTVFLEWVKSLGSILPGQVVAIDGKCLRRSYDLANGKAAIHMVSAFACSNRLVMAQIKTDEKSNEITAIPQLLEVLAIRGCIVTIDAMGWQKVIAAKIQAKGADYVLALKGNQGKLREFVQDYFTQADQDDFEGIDHDYFESTSGEHGRIEIRRHWTLTDLDRVPEMAGWAGLRTIGRVESERHVGESKSVERRYFISSMGRSVDVFANAVRTHWGVVNGLHWCLDVGFRENECRVRKKYAAENFATIRHIALNLLKQEKKLKAGIQSKRLNCGWDHAYLAKVLSG